MKVKTSVTLSNELIEAIDEYGQPYKNRSDFIEAAIWAFIKQIIRDQENARDIEIINRNAERLMAEPIWSQRWGGPIRWPPFEWFRQADRRTVRLG